MNTPQPVTEVGSPMRAFYRAPSGELVKVYRVNDDWRTETQTGAEFWFSYWTADPLGSLFRALADTCRRIGLDFDSELVEYTAQPKADAR